MERFPLTAAGAVLWQTWLYAQTLEVIQQEANDAEDDFKGLVERRFDINPGQVAYLEGLADALTDQWGASVAFFINHRLPIELIKPEESPEVRSSKLILSKEELRTLAPTMRTQVDGPTFEGVLQFHITY